MTDAQAPAAGWYLDPGDARLIRWWTGASWSEATAPVPGAEPETAVASASWPAPQFGAAAAPRRAPRAAALDASGPASTPMRLDASQPALTPDPQLADPQLAADATTPSATAPRAPLPLSGDDPTWNPDDLPALPSVPRRSAASSAYIPYSAETARTTSTSSAQTAGIWLLAFIPTIAGVIDLLFGMLTVTTGPTSRVPVLVAVTALCWIFAFLDQRALRSAGFPATSILWMLLLAPLAYLIARGRAVRRGGGTAWPAELVYVLQIVLSAAAVIALVVFLESLGA